MRTEEEMMELSAKTYKQGYKDAMEGLTEKDNPHSGTKNYTLASRWLAGYKEFYKKQEEKS